MLQFHKPRLTYLLIVAALAVLNSAAILLTGCAHREYVTLSPPSRIPTTRPTGQSEEQIRKMIFWLNRGEREFYMGDGLGDNRTLILLSGGHYTLNVRGCLGLYGAALGRWKLADNQIILEADESSGVLREQSLAVLHIYINASSETQLPSNNIYLVPSDELNWFEQSGPIRFNCFQPDWMVTEE